MSGTVTKQNIWQLFLDSHLVIQKKYNMFYFETTKQNVTIENSTVNHPLDYSENILCLYDLLIQKFSELYSNIEDKDILIQFFNIWKNQIALLNTIMTCHVIREETINHIYKYVISSQ